MEHEIEVFYVTRFVGNRSVTLTDGTHESTGGRSEDVAKFFSQEDADAHHEALRHHIAGLSVERRVERMIDQHVAHRPG